MLKLLNLKINIRPTYLILILSAVLGLTVYLYFPKSLENTIGPRLSENNEVANEQEEKSHLAIPFSINQIDVADGTFSPFGVYRKTGDLIGFGHSGIDIPLVAGAEIYAAQNGTVVLVEKAIDDRPGYNLKIIFESAKDGSGQGFYYENINPLENIKVGTKVAKGQLIAKNALGKYANSHFQLSNWYNNYTYFKDARCWIDELSSADKTKIEEFFEKHSKTANFVRAWNTASEEGKLTYKGLLDTSEFPSGPQLCYPPGTDGRITL